MSFVDELASALESLNEDEDGEAIEESAPYWGETGWDAIAESGENSVEVEVDGKPVTVKVVETSTGTYDGDTFIIVEVDGKFYRQNGWTASHYGTEWEGSFEEVEPFEVTETRWKVKR